MAMAIGNNTAPAHLTASASAPPRVQPYQASTTVRAIVGALAGGLAGGVISAFTQGLLLNTIYSSYAITWIPNVSSTSIIAAYSGALGSAFGSDIEESSYISVASSDISTFILLAGGFFIMHYSQTSLIGPIITITGINAGLIGIISSAIGGAIGASTDDIVNTYIPRKVEWIKDTAYELKKFWHCLILDAKSMLRLVTAQDLNKFNDEKLSWLKASIINKLPPEEIGKLKAHALKGLSVEEIGKLSKDAFMDLSSEEKWNLNGHVLLNLSQENSEDLPEGLLSALSDEEALDYMIQQVNYLEANQDVSCVRNRMMAIVHSREYMHVFYDALEKRMPGSASLITGHIG